MMQEFDLSVGDALRIGNRVITLIDIDGIEAAFRVDELPSEHSELDAVEEFPPAK
jgi:hypothetical protein